MGKVLVMKDVDYSSNKIETLGLYDHLSTEGSSYKLWGNANLSETYAGFGQIAKTSGKIIGLRIKAPKEGTLNNVSIYNTSSSTAVSVSESFSVAKGESYIELSSPVDVVKGQCMCIDVSTGGISCGFYYSMSGGDWPTCTKNEQDNDIYRIYTVVFDIAYND